jgi:PAS domain S-box-containing protein
VDEEKRKADSEKLNLKTDEILSYIQEKSHEDLHDKDVEELINELQLYQAELEIQIEELKQTQNSLEESRRQYFELYNLAPVGYFTLTAMGIIEEVNLTGADMLGVNRRMLKGARMASFIHSSSRDQFGLHISAVNRTKEKQFCELKMRTVDKTAFWIDMKSVPVLDETGELQGIRTAILDITERKKREEIEQRLSDIVQNTYDAVIMQDFSGNILAWNKGAREMYGYKEDEALKINISKLLPAHKKNEMDDVRQKLLQGHRTVQLETQRVTRTGNVVHVHASFSAQPDANGRPITISSIERDITEKKRHEADRKRLIRQLVREQNVLEAIINQLPVGILIAEPPDGRVIMKNDLVDKIFRYAWGMPQSYDEYGSQRKLFYLDSRQYEKADIPLLRALKKGETVENEVAIFERGDGSRGMLNMNASPVRDEKGEIMAGIVIIQDISSRVEEEHKMMESRDFADNIITSMRDGLLVLDENMKVVRCNLSFCKLFDVKSKEIEGRLFSELGTANWDIPELKWLLERLLENARAINDYEVIKEFPKIGRRIMIINGRPVLDREGKPDLILLTFKDVTRQRVAEEEIQRLNALLLKRYVELQNTNRDLESFTYSVSHDLRGPLRAMDGFSRLLQEEFSDKLDEKGRHYLERIRSGAAGMSDLIDDLLRLSRISQSDIEYSDVNLSKVASKFANELIDSNPKRKVGFEIQPDVIARGDGNLLRQVLENLIRNAWKYSKGKADSRIEFGMKRINGEWTYFVRDNGIGFDMKYADKLFMPFQRLHSSKEYSGTGIGLSIVKRIVDGHEGKVWAETKEGEGATFYFTLGNQEE